MQLLKTIFDFQPIDASDDSFWDQFWSENVTNVQDVFTLVPAPEIRALREEAPSNLATLCYKAVEKLVKAVDSSCRTQHEQQTGWKYIDFFIINLVITKLHYFILTFS